jgi:hypothetical protein
MNTQNYSGCPIEWNLTLTASMPENDRPPLPKELSSMTTDLGDKISIEQVAIQVKDSKGKWTSFRGGSFYTLSVALSGKPFQIIYRISKEGCSQSANFSAIGVFPTFSLNRLSIGDYLSSSNGYGISTLNFLQKIQIEKNLDQCSKNYLKAASTLGRNGNSESFGFKLPFCNTKDLLIEIYPSFHQVECLHINPDFSYYLKQGEVCDISFVAGVTDVLDVKLIGPKKSIQAIKPTSVKKIQSPIVTKNK